MDRISVAVKFIPVTMPCSRVTVLAKAVSAKAVAAVEPMEPLAGTFELLQTSYGAPVLLKPVASTTISILTCVVYSGIPGWYTINMEATF